MAHADGVEVESEKFGGQANWEHSRRTTCHSPGHLAARPSRLPTCADANEDWRQAHLVASMASPHWNRSAFSTA